MKKTILTVAFILMVTLVLAACANDSSETVKSTRQIYLYGEQHGVEKIMDKQLELWGEYYRNDNMRHLFVELPCYTAEFLNIWMRSDSGDILDEIYDEWAGTAMYVPYTKVFYTTIKSQYPETIFIGTDIGHQYNTTGERFLRYLEENNLKDSDQYLLTQRAIDQGKHYYGNSNDLAYRVTQMTENFIREFDKLADKNIMGIYGSAHTALGNMQNQSFSTMAERLKERYGDAVHLESLTWLAQDADPLKTDVITVGGKEYEATYFGEQDLSGFGMDFISREFWRLENAYNDFKDKPKTGDVLPYGNYPMQIETGQIFVIDYTKSDGTVTRMYYRSDGNSWQGSPATEEFRID